MPATELQRLTYRDKYCHLFGKDFQSWFEDLARELHPTGDFQAIRNTSGDGGLDAFVINSQLVYSVYAPARDVERNDGRTAAKMQSDFANAIRTLHGNLRAWAFVHNHPEAKLGHLSAAEVSDLESANPHVTFEVLNIDSLWEKLRTLSDEALKRLFPNTGIASWNPRDHYEHPPATGPCFGREVEVEAYVSNCCKESPVPAIVLGGPGIGKSAVARAVLNHPAAIARFGWRRFWVNCETVSDHLSLMAEAARVVGLRPSPEPEPCLMYELQQAHSCLVLDNLETPLENDDVAVRQFLARLVGVGGVALVTTRRGDAAPGDLGWFGHNCLQPLGIEHARDAFCAIAGGKVADGLLLDKLLNAVEYVPLAISLLAHQARGRTDLKYIWVRWTEQKTKMLRRGKGNYRLDNLEISIELSIALLDQPGLRVLSLLALLPAGCDEVDLVQIAGADAIESGELLRQVGLAELRVNRLYSLAPIREYVAVAFPVASTIIDRADEHFGILTLDLSDKLGKTGGHEAAELMAVEYANITTLVARRMPSYFIDNLALIAIALGQFARFTVYGDTDIIEFLLNTAHSTRDATAEAVCAQCLGEMALVRSDHDSATNYFKRCIDLYTRLGEPLGIGDCKLSLGRVLFAQSDHAEALGLYAEALQIYESRASLGGQGNCKFNMGRIALLRSDTREAARFIKEAQRLYRTDEDTLSEANCAYSLGDIALNRLDLDTATTEYNSALEQYVQGGDFLGTANCQLGLGKTALSRAEYSEAKKLCSDAMALYSQLRYEVGIGNCHQLLGDICYRAQDLAAAETQYTQAFYLSRKVANTLGEAVSVFGLGEVAFETGKHDKAEPLYERALPLFEAVGDVLGQANCIKSLADIQTAQSDFAGAEGRYDQALSLYQNVRSVTGEANCIWHLAELAVLGSDEANARQLLTLGLELYTQIDEPRRTGWMHVWLARLSKASERAEHVCTARALWTPLKIPDLMRLLDEEFGAETEYPAHITGEPDE